MSSSAVALHFTKEEQKALEAARLKAKNATIERVTVCTGRAALLEKIAKARAPSESDDEDDVRLNFSAKPAETEEKVTENGVALPPLTEKPKLVKVKVRECPFTRHHMVDGKLVEKPRITKEYFINGAWVERLIQNIPPEYKNWRLRDGILYEKEGDSDEDAARAAKKETRKTRAKTAKAAAVSADTKGPDMGVACDIDCLHDDKPAFEQAKPKRAPRKAKAPDVTLEEEESAPKAEPTKAARAPRKSKSPEPAVPNNTPNNTITYDLEPAVPKPKRAPRKAKPVVEAPAIYAEQNAAGGGSDDEVFADVMVENLVNGAVGVFKRR